MKYINLWFVIDKFNVKSVWMVHVAVDDFSEVNGGSSGL